MIETSHKTKLENSSAGNRTTMRVDRLKPNPKQELVFDEMSPLEFERLKESIKQNGLVEPITVLTNGTIISGHNRCKAAQALGWIEIDVRIREDLNGDQRQADAAFIVANLDRRDMPPMQTARAMAFYEQLQRSMPDVTTGDSSIGTLRQQVAERFGVSRRHADRLLKLLALPLEFQRAIDTKKIKINDASRILALSKSKQEALLAEADRGTAFKILIPKFLGKAREKKQTSTTIIKQLTEAIKAAQAHFGDDFRGKGFVGLSAANKSLYAYGSDFCQEFARSISDRNRDSR